MISASNLKMRYGGKILFKETNFQFNPGLHYGLVGANGSGKSTLIKMLIGEITPEAGEISLPTQLSIGTLKQDHFLHEEQLILDVVLMGNPKLWNALKEREAILEKEHFSEKDCHTLESLEKVIHEHDGYTAPSRAAKLLEGLGLLAPMHAQKLSVLSGGFKLRVLLAQVLFSQPDILLLDEPTNHLDIFSIKWLEGYLKNFMGMIVVSSHDREFLNKVCNYIVDVDRETIRIYKGNYDQFEEAKAFEKAHKEAQIDKQDKKKQDLQGFIDRFKSKATKARQAQSKMRLVEKLEGEMDELSLSPSSRMYPNLQFDICRPSGAIALKVDSISKQFGSKHVLSKISFQIERGEHVAFLGANGIGKSTLLEILTQSLHADQGSFEWGFAVQHAYFPQDHAKHVQGNNSLLEWLRQFDARATDEQLRGILGRVLFSGDDVHKTVNILSGGETARLLLAKMMLMKHNVLIFDEPTNHLDMEAIEALLEALHNYPGTLLFVSHNRHFVNALSKRILEITRDGLLDFKCTYPEYLAKRELDLLSADRKAHQMPQANKKNQPSDEKSLYQEQKNQSKQRAHFERKVKLAEDKCHQLEQKIKEIDDLLSSEGFYQKNSKEQQQAILSKKVVCEKSLEDALHEWEKASEELV